MSCELLLSNGYAIHASDKTYAEIVERLQGGGYFEIVTDDAPPNKSLALIQAAAVVAVVDDNPAPKAV